jgi:hypothetical protein
MTADVLDPVARHPECGSRVGAEIVALAREIGVPLSFDLLHLPRDRARRELAHRVATKLLTLPAAAGGWQKARRLARQAGHEPEEPSRV